jgi:uncharacterized damage-inducible protein DinB
MLRPLACGMTDAHDVPPAILDAFARNGEVNAAFLAALRDDDLAASDGHGGWSVGLHLGHAAEFRYDWLHFIAPEHAEAIPSVVEGDPEGGAFHLTTTSVGDIAAVFEAGDAAALAAVRSAFAAGRSFEGAYVSSPSAFLVHAIVHDAHHRGQVASLLRSRGRLSRAELDALDGATWSIWRR